MTTQQRTSRMFERLMRQALHEIEAYRPTPGRRRPSRSLTVDDVDAVPVFDRGPRRGRAEARGRS